MQIDKRTIKALSSDTRLAILKKLAERRRILAELSKELNLKTPTILEHIRLLEDVGLVERKETGQKWIYYELTDKGFALIKPKWPIQFVLTLSLGIVFVFISAANFFTPQTAYGAAQKAAETTTLGAHEFTPPTINWLFVILLILGIALIAYGLFKLTKARILR